LSKPVIYESHREFVRQVLRNETGLRASGPAFVPEEPLTSKSIAYRERILAHGSPSDRIAHGYVWTPGTEAVRRAGLNGNHSYISPSAEVSP
jgi:hypothetical protein